MCTEQCKIIPAWFKELLVENLRHSSILGRVAEHFESDSRNLAGMFLHNSVPRALKALRRCNM